MKSGAGDGGRTRDIDLGKVALSNPRNHLGSFARSPNPPQARRRRTPERVQNGHMAFLLKMVAVNEFILLMPLLLVAASIWGTEDEQWLMRIAFWVTFPFTVILWAIILHTWRKTR